MRRSHTLQRVPAAVVHPGAVTNSGTPGLFFQWDFPSSPINVLCAVPEYHSPPSLHLAQGPWPGSPAQPQQKYTGRLKNIQTLHPKGEGFRVRRYSSAGGIQFVPRNSWDAYGFDDDTESQNNQRQNARNENDATQKTDEWEKIRKLENKKTTKSLNQK